MRQYIDLLARSGQIEKYRLWNVGKALGLTQSVVATLVLFAIVVVMMVAIRLK